MAAVRRAPIGGAQIPSKSAALLLAGRACWEKRPQEKRKAVERVVSRDGVRLQERSRKALREYRLGQAPSSA